MVLGVAVIAFLSAVADRSRGDSFGSGENAFDMEFVTVGVPGNSADTTGAPNPAGSGSESGGLYTVVGGGAGLSTSSTTDNRVTISGET